MNSRMTYHSGLLHLVYLLVNVDGVIEKSERAAMLAIKEEENIPEILFRQFDESIGKRREQDIYHTAIHLINQCTEEEKLCAFVHLYRLAQADNNIHTKEIRLLLYGIKVTNLEFEDVEMSARLAETAAHSRP